MWTLNIKTEVKEELEVGRDKEEKSLSNIPKWCYNLQLSQLLSLLVLDITKTRTLTVFC